MARKWAALRVFFGRHELKPKGNRMTLDLDKTSWTPDRKVVSQAAAMLSLFILGAIFDASNIVLDIPLGIETALAVVIGYLIPNKTRTVVTEERVEEVRTVETEIPDNG
jgi:hypothetical protein